MDWLKLFALLVAVATVKVLAEGPKKKIRIHLPQKVKHIHHHKKIYITNHPAPSQYAPAFMPSAEGTNLVSVNSVEMFDEPSIRMPGIAAAGSKLLPLYKTRGYYGPNFNEWDGQEYDLSPPPEPTDHSFNPAFSGPSAVAAPTTNYSPKKVKIVKFNEPPRKKPVRQNKPKRVVIRGKPQVDEEIPVTSFHEQFYSDLDGSATVKKIKKPQRVEKIIDGDTEHIHTYSEEHIHKLVYDDGSSKLVGVDPVASMSTLSGPHSIIPLKSPLLALSPEALTGFAAMGSMGTPSHLEYAAYNPRDVTHDHVFHDHGEIPADTDASKENLPNPPRVSYNSQGLRIGGGLGSKGYKSKFSAHIYSKPTKPSTSNDYSYYESIFSPYGRPKNQLQPSNPYSQFIVTTESTIEDFRIPSFKSKDKRHFKTRNVSPSLYFGSDKQSNEFVNPQTSPPAPFAVSSTIVHDYKPKYFSSHSSGTFNYHKQNNPLVNFKDNSYTNNYDINSFSSGSSSLYTPEDKNDSPILSFHGKRGKKKKSISTQNIRIGGLDHQTTIDHLDTGGIDGEVSLSVGDESPTALDFDNTKTLESATSTPYMIKESSIAHPYYSAMAFKALHSVPSEIAEASNSNYQYVEAPSISTTAFALPATTTLASSHADFEQDSTEAAATEPTEYVIDTRNKRKLKNKPGVSSILKDTRQRYSAIDLPIKDYKSGDRPVASSHTAPHHASRHSQKRTTASPGVSGSRKYGDKI